MKEPSVLPQIKDNLYNRKILRYQYSCFGWRELFPQRAPNEFACGQYYDKKSLDSWHLILQASQKVQTPNLKDFQTNKKTETNKTKSNKKQMLLSFTLILTTPQNIKTW